MIMTVPRPGGQLPVQEHARARAEQVPGPHTAKRLGTFRNGVVVVGGVDRAAYLDNRVLPVIAILFLVPLLYGGFSGVPKIRYGIAPS